MGNRSGTANKILEAKEKERTGTKAIEGRKRKRSDSRYAVCALASKWQLA